MSLLPLTQSSLLPPIETLNAAELGAFSVAVAVLFEACPLLTALLAAQRPFASYPALIAAAQACVAGLSLEDRIHVVNSHPLIGADHRKLSQLSRLEQGAAPPESALAEIKTLNTEYSAKFGFRFIEFVNGRTNEQLIPIIKLRLQNQMLDELQYGLSAMMLIAKDRLSKLDMQSGNKP